MIKKRKAIDAKLGKVGDDIPTAKVGKVGPSIPSANMKPMDFKTTAFTPGLSTLRAAKKGAVAAQKEPVKLEGEVTLGPTEAKTKYVERIKKRAK